VGGMPPGFFVLLNTRGRILFQKIPAAATLRCSRGNVKIERGLGCGIAA
jgi:hypothetical protein